MTRTAVIMAGGQGERMARSGVTGPKPLVEVRGVTLLEWNVRFLIRSGVDRIFVSVAVGDLAVRDVVATKLRALGAHAHFTVTVDELVEERPLGNIGSVALLAGTQDPVLVVYADNLTGLDLRAIYEDHLAGEADLTLAAHRQPFVMPFGELTSDPADPGRLVSYIEKPTYLPLVSTAVMVLGPRAVSRAAAAGPIGISGLSQALVDEGGEVRLWVHDAPWVDVNDQAGIDQAEALVDRHPEVFADPELFHELRPNGSHTEVRS